MKKLGFCVAVVFSVAFGARAGTGADCSPQEVRVEGGGMSWCEAKPGLCKEVNALGNLEVDARRSLNAAQLARLSAQRELEAREMGRTLISARRRSALDLDDPVRLSIFHEEPDSLGPNPKFLIEKEGRMEKFETTWDEIANALVGRWDCRAQEEAWETDLTGTRYQAALERRYLAALKASQDPCAQLRAEVNRQLPAFSHRGHALALRLRKPASALWKCEQRAYRRLHRHDRAVEQTQDDALEPRDSPGLSAVRIDVDPDRIATMTPEQRQRYPDWMWRLKSMTPEQRLRAIDADPAWTARLKSMTPEERQRLIELLRPVGDLGFQSPVELEPPPVKVDDSPPPLLRWRP